MTDSTVDDEKYLRALVDLLAARGTELTYEEVARTETRGELGIGSLDVIMLVSGYLDDHTDGSVVFQPEWVSRLEAVDGIVSVLREIDRAGLDPASA